MLPCSATHAVGRTTTPGSLSVRDGHLRIDSVAHRAVEALELPVEQVLTLIPLSDGLLLETRTAIVRLRASEPQTLIRAVLAAVLDPCRGRGVVAEDTGQELIFGTIVCGEGVSFHPREGTRHPWHGLTEGHVVDTDPDGRLRRVRMDRQGGEPVLLTFGGDEAPALGAPPRVRGVERRGGVRIRAFPRVTGTRRGRTGPLPLGAAEVIDVCRWGMALLVPANVAVGEKLDLVVTLPPEAGRTARSFSLTGTVVNAASHGRRCRVGLHVPGSEMSALFSEIEREMLRTRSAERRSEG